MKRLPLSLGAALLLCGCIVPYKDPCAEEALRRWETLSDAPQTLTLEAALPRAKGFQEANEVHRQFALLRRAKLLTEQYRAPLRPDELRAAILDGECARIRLNALLGFRPDVPVVYDTAGAFDVPKELPDPVSVAKAALMSDDPAAPPQTTLERVALAHARAVTAYDAAAQPAAPETKIDRECARVLAALDLANALAMPLTGFNGISGMAGRFDTVKRHRDVTFR